MSPRHIGQPLPYSRQMPQAAAFAVAPQEAIDYLRSKLRVPTATWTDIWQEMHARAFVIAGAQSDALLADFHEAVTRAIAEGRTLEQFRADFDRIVEAHGWSYKGSRGWRSAVIFNTNLRMAYAAGRWQRIQAVKRVRPYLRYIAVMDERTRPLHRAWHNTVLPVDHPWWTTHFPPNGWNCRCSIQSLSESDLKRLGLKVTETPPPLDLVPRSVNSPSGKVTLMVPKGIDPGFAYNPGLAGFGRGPESVALETHGAWTPLTSPFAAPALDPLPRDAAPVLKVLAPETAGDLRFALTEALTGAEAIIADPLGGRTLVSQALADALIAKGAAGFEAARYFPALRLLLEDPAEIWVGWVRFEVSGRVALRRRHLRVIRLADGRLLGLVADIDGGMLSGFETFPVSETEAEGLRSGLRIFRRA